ncbi:MAG: GNAT family N-acetyltransferase [Lachnospiraceae bacterium]|nr:GNAT family N-acetyltransferase [Lachnospiraceae bacterium]
MDTYKDDIEWTNKFNLLKYNNIVTLENTTTGAGEVFEVVHNDHQYYLQPFSSCLSFPMSTPEQTKAIVSFFQNMDKSFENYLGIGGCPSEDEAITEIQRLLNKERDGRHKYYVIQKQFGQPIGLFYVYEYHPKYKRCNIAIGLSYEYRGKGLSKKIISDLCDALFTQGIIRIGIETETTNISSLKCCEKLCTALGFKKEGVLRNLYGKGIDSVVFSLIPENK